jgi:hypothetical protein
MLFLSGTSADFSARQIGRRVRADNLPAECEYVLDGQQRLSSLYSLIADPFGVTDWDDAVRHTFWNLRYRWGLRIRTEDGEADYFGEKLLDLKPLPTEPEGLTPRLLALRVKLEQPGPSDWHHPAWDGANGVPSAAEQLKIVKAAADRRIVPMWRIAADGPTPDALHTRVLQELGRRRKDELEAEITDGSIRKGLTEALYRIRPDINTADPAQLIDALPDLRAQWVQSMTQLLSRMADYQVPLVDLPVAQVDRAIVIFESMNRGGTPLSTFDLLAARLAKTDTDRNLSELLYERITNFSLTASDELWGALPVGDRTWKPRPGSIGLYRDSPSTVFKNAFLSVLALLVAVAEQRDLTTDSVKQQAVLAMTPEQVGNHWERATDAILRAWAFLQLRCGVRSEGDLRNKLLLLPLAVALRSEDVLTNKVLLNRLEYWYWSSVLTSTYTERQNENSIEDTKKLITWAATGTMAENPFQARRTRVFADPGYSDGPTLLRETEDAGVATDAGIYLLQYELSRGPLDILSTDYHLLAWVDATEDHHLVPLGSATSVGESSHEIRKATEGIGRLLNSPLNRSLISVESNRKIASMSIHQYLESVPEAARIARGLPPLSAIQSTTQAEETARTIMRHRYDSLFDRATEELDGLLSS